MAPKDFGQLPAEAQNISPFTVNISQKSLDDLKTLLQLSQIAEPTYENNNMHGGRYGVTRDWIISTKDHWLQSYDWRRCEGYINSFPNFHATVEHDDVLYTIHFVALISQMKADNEHPVVPILSVHGWPGSFLEYLPQAGLIADSYSAHDLPYHLVIPSLIGYGFSSPPPSNKDFDLHTLCAVFDKLMTVNLGFNNGYITTGGDIGSGVARILGAKYDSCKAIQINFCNMRLDVHSKEGLSKLELEGLERGRSFMATGSAYAMEQGTRPGTLGFVLQSSPIALLAWVGEKFLAWSDESPPTDIILDDVTLYWLTRSIPSSFFSYRMRIENKTIGHDHPELLVTKPIGYQYFPKEVVPIPKSWVAKTGTLSWYREHRSGGHFAALEKPAEIKKDLEDFLAHLRERQINFAPKENA